MRRYVRSIRVEDASGAQFELDEFEVGAWIWKRQRLQLDTGELARAIDPDTFALLRTGEHFVRVG